MFTPLMLARKGAAVLWALRLVVLVLECQETLSFQLVMLVRLVKRVILSCQLGTVNITWVDQYQLKEELARMKS